MSGVEVYCIGELLVDVIPAEPGGLYEGKRFEVHFGGAPANVAVGIARLGHRSGMVAAVGQDAFGDFLIRSLEENGVDARFVARKPARTTLAIVVLGEEGERDFFFYREPWSRTADTLLSPEDVDVDELARARVLHVSGFSTSHRPIRDAVHVAVEGVREREVFVSYDPTFRRDVWRSLEKAKEEYVWCLARASMVSLGFDELSAFHPDEGYREVAEKILSKYPNVEVVAVRLGSRGAYVRSRDGEALVPAFKVRAVDTTGAGDAWTAAFIVYHVLEGLDIGEAARYANAAAAVTCTRRGAIAAFPSRRDVEELAGGSRV